MAAPIRSSVEIDLILNKGNNAIADLGYDIIGDGKRGADLSDTDFRDKVYRLVLLRGYLRNLVTDAGTFRNYYQASANEKKFNNLLDGVNQLSKGFAGPGVPLIRGKRIPLIAYPSSPGNSNISNSSGGPATPGGVTFQNISVSSPSEIIDLIDASSCDYAFYIVNIQGTGSGEGSRLDMIGVNWRGSNTPVITEYRGSDIGGSTAGVTISAALNGGNIEITANVPTNGWIVKGNRISFENISFQNALGPLPIGGTLNQYLKKLSSTNYDVAWEAIAMSDITGLSAQLTNYLLLAGGTMSGAIAMGSQKITGLGAGTTNGDALRYEQLVGIYALASSLSSYLQLAGGTMSGPINMGSQKITSLAAASGNGEALRYEQLIGLYALLTGATFSGAIAMGGNKITGLAAATANGDAVRYEQISSQLVQTLVSIGDWNMDSTTVVTIAHGLTLSKIREVSAMIISDDSVSRTPLISGDPGGTGTLGGGIQIDSTNVSLVRTTSGFFDNTNYDATSFNRGFIVIYSIP